MKILVRTPARSWLATHLLLACLLSGAGPACARDAEEILPAENEANSIAPLAGKPVFKGIAAYYAKKFDGRKTRSGETYDPEKMTAAHPDFPFGTTVRVVNLANGREVTVIVNDRCRRKNVPFIDLSRAAARELGFLGKGTAKVAFSVVDGNSKP